MDDDEEGIEVSGSPFAPASDYLGEREFNPEAIIQEQRKQSTV